MVNNAIKVAKILKDKKDINLGVINCRFIKPLDCSMLSDIKEKYKYIFTIEEGCIQGGFGSSVLEYFSKFEYDNIINLIGVDDEFIEHGSRKELLELTGLSVSRIYDKIIEVHEK